MIHKDQFSAQEAKNISHHMPGHSSNCICNRTAVNITKLSLASGSPRAVHRTNVSGGSSSITDKGRCNKVIFPLGKHQIYDCRKLQYLRINFWKPMQVCRKFISNKLFGYEEENIIAITMVGEIHVQEN